MEDKYCINCDMPVIDKKPPCPLQCMSPECRAYEEKVVIDTAKKPVIWIMGGPGSGKNRVCQRIAQTYGFTQLSAGELLRSEVAKGGTRAKCLTSCMDRGSLVPNDIVLGLIKDTMLRMEEEGDRTKGFVLDGFPREKYQGIQFERQIGHVALIVLLEAPYDLLYARLAERTYPTTGRTDTRNLIKLRLDTFFRYQPAVTEVYKDRIFRVNAEQVPDMIFSDLQKPLDKIIAETQNAVLATAMKPADSFTGAGIAHAKLLRK